MSSAVIWTGPVSSAQVKGATLPDASLYFIPCTGDGKPTCGEMAEAWKDSEGRILPKMLEHLKVKPFDGLWGGAFSAGGQIWKRVLLNEKDRQMVSGLLLSDGDYETGWVDKKAGEAHFSEGFVLFGLDALKDGRVFIATASGTPNVSPSTKEVFPSGNQVLLATMREIEKRGGVQFQEVTELWPLHDLRAPVHVWRLNNVVFADFGMNYKHPEHATILAHRVWGALSEITSSNTGQEGNGPGINSTQSEDSGGLPVGKVVVGLIALAAIIGVATRKKM